LSFPARGARRRAGTHIAEILDREARDAPGAGERGGDEEELAEQVAEEEPVVRERGPPVRAQSQFKSS